VGRQRPDQPALELAAFLAAQFQPAIVRLDETPVVAAADRDGVRTGAKCRGEQVLGGSQMSLGAASLVDRR